MLCKVILGKAISIHALREEGDHRCAGGLNVQADFYPRPPRGGRRPDPAGAVVSDQFLSTPSARRATPAPANFFRISLFLSTPSARRATMYRDSYNLHIMISIHALREEGDQSGFFYVLVL